LAQQAAILEAFGARPPELQELLAYNANSFHCESLFAAPQLPLDDEPMVTFWERCITDAASRGSYAALCERLPQLSFPIRAGLSESGPYRAATLRGVPPAELPEATGLALLQPERLSIVLYQSAAGRIPLILTRCRDDFVSLVQALTRRNEPWPVPDAMGAQMVSGYLSWGRLHAHRRAWEALPAARRATATWEAELQRLLPQRELYQDRFILLTDGPYSAVPATDLGLDDTRWRELSLAIRREHECTHYFTRRLFGVMRNNLLDELIADYVGIASALGRLAPAWLLRFLGLEDASGYRAGGRLEIYRGTPPLSPVARLSHPSPLSDAAFGVLQRLVRAAVANLARFDVACEPRLGSPRERALLIAALATLRLEDLAGSGALASLEAAYRHALEWVPASGCSAP
jgi:hypothetical protein